MKLIKSSIYKAKGQLARYIGQAAPDVSGNPQHAFSAHGREIIAGISDIETVPYDEVRRYLAPPVPTERELAAQWGRKY